MSEHAFSKDNVRKPLVTLAHVRFPYTAAKITMTYITENRVLKSTVLSAYPITKIFELGALTTETLVFAFSRRNKPPDMPSLLSQYTGINKRVLLSHTVIMAAPEVDLSTGTTEYSCSGSAVYLLEYSDIYNLQSKTFFYPRGPYDGNDIFPHSSSANGDREEDWTSFVYDWMGGMEYSTIPKV